MLRDFLRRLFPRSPTAFELLAQRVRGARQEAARLAAYADAGRRRLEELMASQKRWERRAGLASARGFQDLAEAANRVAQEDAERVSLGLRQLQGMLGDAEEAREIMDQMLTELERVSVSAVSAGARLPVVEIDDAAARRVAEAEATEAEQLDGLDDAMDRDWLDRAFERIERPALH